MQYGQKLTGTVHRFERVETGFQEALEVSKASCPSRDTHHPQRVAQHGIVGESFKGPADLKCSAQSGARDLRRVQRLAKHGRTSLRQRAS
jgi:hypothetical protein